MYTGEESSTFLFSFRKDNLVYCSDIAGYVTEKFALKKIQN